MNGLKCINCGLQFTNDFKLPLVLPCGDSICIQCILLFSSSNQSNLFRCPVCWQTYEVTNSFIKDLPKNKALLLILNSYENPSQKAGPLPKVLFASTPEPKRFSESPQKNYGFMTPSTYSNPLQFTSPNSVAVKCARIGCNNDRFYINGEVWDYCCINCREAARLL